MSDTATLTRKDLEGAVTDFFQVIGPLARQETPDTLSDVGVTFLRKVAAGYAERVARIAHTLLGTADITTKPEDRAWLLLAQLAQTLPATVMGFKEDDEVLLVHSLHETLMMVWDMADGVGARIEVPRMEVAHV